VLPEAAPNLGRLPISIVAKLWPEVLSENKRGDPVAIAVAGFIGFEFVGVENSLGEFNADLEVVAGRRFRTGWRSTG